MKQRLITLPVSTIPGAREELTHPFRVGKAEQITITFSRKGFWFELGAVYRDLRPATAARLWRASKPQFRRMMRQLDSWAARRYGPSARVSEVRI